MVNDAQTHSLPESEEELTTCARRLGYSGTHQKTAAESFMKDYQTHTTQVSRIFEEVFGADGLKRFTRSDA
jgi:glutamine synthetase adenylyltransferase